MFFFVQGEGGACFLEGFNQANYHPNTSHISPPKAPPKRLPPQPTKKSEHCETNTAKPPSTLQKIVNTYDDVLFVLYWNLSKLRLGTSNYDADK